MYASDSWFSKALEAMTRAELDSELVAFKAEAAAGRIDDSVIEEVMERLDAIAKRERQHVDELLRYREQRAAPTNEERKTKGN